MDGYKKMYYTLFNKLTDIIYELQMVQRQTEEMCPRPDAAVENGEARGEACPRRDGANGNHTADRL